MNNQKQLDATIEALQKILAASERYGEKLKELSRRLDSTDERPAS
jgi:hypothetical protein